jgi:hypothetical protein
MNTQDLINWGELSRLLSGSRMNIRKNRIPQKYEADVQKLVSHIETWQAEIQTANAKAVGQKNKNNLQDVN